MHTVYGGEGLCQRQPALPWSVDRRDYSDRRIRQVSVALETRTAGAGPPSGTPSWMFGTWTCHLGYASNWWMLSPKLTGPWSYLAEPIDPQVISAPIS